MGPVAGCLVENASRSDLKSVAQQGDVVYMVSMYDLCFVLFQRRIKEIGQWLQVCCLLERLRGAARATQPRTQKVLFEMGRTVMNPLLTLLEVYKNHVMLFFKHHTITLQVNVEDHAIKFSPSLQSSVVYMILKFVVDFVDGQAVFLDAKETSALVNFCLRLLQIYSSHNIGKVRI